MSLSSNVNDLATRIATEFNSVRSEMSNAGAGVIISETAPETDGIWFNSTNGQIYVRYDNTWVGVAGETGAAGPGYYAHLVYNTGVDTGSVTFGIDAPTTIDGLAFRTGDKVRGRMISDSSAYFDGTITSLGVSPLTVTINVTYSVNTGMNTSGYTLGLLGDKGDTGAAGTDGQGVAAGGTTGQYLTKVNGTDYNTQWSTLDLSSYATKTGSETLTNKTITSPIIDIVGSTNFAQNVSIYPSTTTGNINIGASQTSGSFNISSGSSHSGSVNIAAGATSSSRTVNIGTGATGGTTSVNIGSNGGATSNVSLYGNVSATGALTFSQNSTTDTDPLLIQSKNGHGGAGFAGLLTFKNTTSGATNPHKFFRMTSNGTLEIINSAYSNTIFSLTDAGVLNVNGAQLDNVAWNSYTPSLRTESGTWTVGNGSISAKYKTIGKTCFFRMKVVVGSTTSIGAGALVFGLPVTAASADYQFAGSMLDNGNAWYQVTGNGNYLNSTTEFACIVYSGSGRSSQGIANNVPFNFLDGDYITISGSYECA